MTFEDLPEDWDKQPLTDPALASDAVDLFLSDRDRRLNSLLVVLCDEDLHPLQPVVIDGVDWRCSAASRRNTLSFITHFPVGGVILTISCSFPIPEDVAERWHRTAQTICEASGPPLLHFFSAIPHSQPKALSLLPPAFSGGPEGLSAAVLDRAHA